MLVKDYSHPSPALIVVSRGARRYFVELRIRNNIYAIIIRLVISKVSTSLILRINRTERINMLAAPTVRI